MKRLAIATLVALSTILTTTSCTLNEDATPIVQFIDVMPEMWQPSGQFGQPGYHIYARVSMPLITSSVISYGMTNVYLLESYGDIPLPIVEPNQGFISTLSYEIARGYITFTLTDSDFKTTPYRTPLRFKLVIIE